MLNPQDNNLAIFWYHTIEHDKGIRFGTGHDQYSIGGVNRRWPAMNLGVYTKVLINPITGVSKDSSKRRIRLGPEAREVRFQIGIPHHSVALHSASAHLPWYGIPTRRQ